MSDDRVQAGPLAPPPRGLDDEAWVEVVAKMEEVYADLLRYEVELEEKNAALEEAHGFVSGVLSTMSDLLIVCDGAGVMRELNPAVLKATGFSEAELSGRPIEDLFETGAEVSFLAAKNGDGPAREGEARLATKSGLGDLYSFTCAARIDARGRRAGLVLTGRPVGELRRAYAALARAHEDLKVSQRHALQAEKMASLGRLVAGVAHELNNPISFVYANVHALSGYVGRIERYLAAVHAAPARPELHGLREELKIDALTSDLAPLTAGALEGATRVRDIVKALRRLSFAGGEDAGAVDLGEVAKAAAAWAKKDAPCDADIRFDLSPDLFVAGRANELRQVALNIIQNAMDAMREASSPILEVIGRREGSDITVRFCDRGPGVPDADLPRIFDPFFTTKKIGEGTGLGLWVSFDIVKSHGGELTARNRAEGGAEFVMRLPAAK